MKLNKALLLSTVLALCVTLPAAAMAAQVPSSADPGRFDQRLSSPSLDTGPAAPVSPSIEAAEPHTQLPEGAEKIRFVLKGIALEGNTIFTESDLHYLYADKIGQDVSLADMINVADKITAKYRNAGYILTRAVVPPQSIDDGIVHIQVVEGFISKVILDGELADNHILQGYAHKIEQSKPITAKTLERYLLLANDIPGVKVKGVLQRSPNVVGGAELAMKIDRKMVSAGASYDNRGSKFLGPNEESFSASLDNVLNLAEQIGVSYTNAGNGELNYYGAFVSIGLNDSGTRLMITGSHTRTQPGYTLEELDTRGFSDTLGLQISHPFIRTREENLQAFARLDGRNTENTQLGTITSEDKIRSVRIGANYQVADNWNGVNVINGLYSHGLNALSARRSGSANLSRLNGKSDYSKVNLDVQRLQSITPSLNLLVAGSGQYAFDDLLASEQFGLGGTEFGRGYDSSEIVGDHGIAGKAELQYNYNTGYEALELLQPYAFYDIGKVTLRTPLPAEQKSRSLSSTGLGLRIKMNDYLSGNLEVAKPLTRVVATEGNKDTRFFFGVSARY